MNLDSAISDTHSQSSTESTEAQHIQEHEDIHKYIQESTNLVNSKFQKKTLEIFQKKWLLKNLLRNDQLLNFPKTKIQFVKSLSALEVRSQIFEENYKTEYQKRLDREKGVAFRPEYDLFIRMYDQIKSQHFLCEIQVKKRLKFELRKSLALHKINQSELLRPIENQKLKEETSNALAWSSFHIPRSNAQAINGYISGMSILQAKRKFPLIGYVITVSDRIYQKNMPTASGLFRNLNRVAKEQPIILQILSNAGAVFTSKGSTPQLMLSLEAESNTQGIVSHFANPKRTAGGSMAGDAVLMGIGANNFAIGVDFAGMGRVSALWNGLWGFRLSQDRFENTAIANCFDRMFDSQIGKDADFYSVPKFSSLGKIKKTQNKLKNQKNENLPDNLNKEKQNSNIITTNHRSSQKFLTQSLFFMSKCPHDFQTVFNLISENQKMNLHCPNLKWNLNPQIPEGKKKIGVIREMPFIESCPTALRALDNAIVAFLEAGYEVYDIDLFETLKQTIEWATIALHKDNRLADLVTKKTGLGEPLVNKLDPFKRTHSAISLVNKWALKRVNESRLSFFRSCFIKSQNTSESEIEIQQKKLFAKVSDLMMKSNLSAILTSGLSFPALRHGESRDVSLLESHLYIWDFLKMPNAVAGIVKVRHDETNYKTKWKDKMANVLKNSIKTAQGLNLGVSLSVLPFQDEILLKIMMDIKDNLGVLL